MKSRVVIYVKDGLVQAVYSNNIELDVDVFDLDINENEAYDESQTEMNNRIEKYQMKQVW